MVGVSVRTMMSSAERAGVHANGMDYFGDMDTNRSGKTLGLANDLGMEPSMDNLLQAARERHSDDYLLYFSGPENSPDELAFWHDRGLLLGNSPITLRLTRDPFWVQARLEQIGESLPEFYRLDKAPQYLGKPFLLKPINQGGGHGIKVLRADTPWRHQVEVEDETYYILQRFCTGQSASFTFLGDGEKAFFIGASSQWPDADGFSYCGNMAPLYCLTPELEQRMDRIAQHLAKSAGLVGLNTVDIILDEREMYVLEVNPRWSASVELYEVLWDTSLFEHHVQACRKRLIPLPEKPLNGFAAKAIVYAKRNMTMGYFRENDWEELYGQDVRDLPRPGTYTQIGQPMCTVLARGKTAEECRKRLAEREAWVRKYFDEHEGRQ